MYQIVTILPKDEGFSPGRFGAIALCVRDFTLHSRFRQATLVLGGIGNKGFDGVAYRLVPHGWFFENRTRAYARGCAKIINRENTELAEIHNRPQLLRLIAPQVKCRLVLHLHNDPREMRGAKTPKEREELLALCNGVYCVSEYIRQCYLEGLPASLASKLQVVHNGIEIPSTLPRKEKLIVYAGRMTAGKGALLLAKALRLAMPQLPGWNAVMIGSDRHSVSEKPSEHEALVIHEMHGVERARLAGFLSHEETIKLFARAAIAVVPSVWGEPFGRTAIEAMAYGCAVISSGRGALQEVTGDAALTIDDLTPEQLAENIVALARGEALSSALQSKARERAKQFDIAKCAATLDNIRETILQGISRHVA